MIHGLIVEDEKTIRNGIARYIHWKELGVAEVQTAASAEEALLMLDDYRPELVLTDIRMNGMDGTILASRVRQRLPETQIIFITGYTDKEYLQSAITVGAVGYVEKPVDPKELSGVVRKAVARIRKSQKNLGFSIHALLNGEIQGTDMNPSLLENYVFFVLRFLAKPILREKDCSKDLEQYLLTESGRETISVSHDLLDQQSYAILISRLSGWGEASIHQMAENISSYFAEKGQACFVSCSREGHGGDAAREVLKGAMDAQKNLSWKGWNTWSCPDEKSNQIREVIPEAELARFRTMIGARQLQQAEDFVHVWTGKLLEKHAALNLYTRNNYYDMERVILHFQGEDGLSDAKVQSDIARCATFRELEEHVEERIRDMGRDAESAPSNQQIETVCRYIGEHLGDQDLSTAKLAEVVGLSGSYLSSLFSQNKNITISQYITERRMERAMELLKNPRYKLYEVAYMVGYDDAKYFSKQFRKVIGVTPRDFRNSL